MFFGDEVGCWGSRGLRLMVGVGTFDDPEILTEQTGCRGRQPLPSPGGECEFDMPRGTRVLAFASQKREFFTKPLVSELPDGFGSNANMICYTFGVRSYARHTGAAANAKRTPFGCPFGWLRH